MRVLPAVALVLVGCGLETSPLGPVVGIDADAGPDDAGLGDGGSPGCSRNAECDDLVACTRDECTGGLCGSTADNALCGDGERCDLVRGCVVWSCDEDGDCDDAIVCTVHHCDPGTGDCRLAPEAVDGDGDGELDVACGGLDCDDADPLIWSEALDSPDAQGADTNCDGADGDVDLALWVSTDGNDQGPGSAEDPLASVQAGVERAFASAVPTLIVAEGRYVGRVEVVAPLAIEGGWVREAGAWTQEDGARPVLEGDGTGVLVRDVSGLVVLRRLAIESGASEARGASQYGLRAARATDLVLSDVAVTAGPGSAGADGIDGVAGAQGGGGSVGADGVWYCNTDNAGAAGGDGVCGGGRGGPGGDGLCGESGTGYTGWPGDPGEGGALPGGGGGGGESTAEFGRPGGDGEPGAPGADGGNGPTVPSWGSASGEEWSPSAGLYGEAGPSAGGGGGGGGGGGNHNNGSYYSGGAGGGGGEGGCGGEPGGGGQGGGWSFGIFLIGSNLTAMRGSVAAGAGGEGGQGGDGGRPGPGGPGGPGGMEGQSFTSGGGRGGDGGPGARGGAGSGGPGGWSCGIYRSDDSVMESDAQVSLGAAGVGGPGGTGAAAGNAGGDGRADALCESADAP